MNISGLSESSKIVSCCSAALLFGGIGFDLLMGEVDDAFLIVSAFPIFAVNVVGISCSNKGNPVPSKVEVNFA